MVMIMITKKNKNKNEKIIKPEAAEIRRAALTPGLTGLLCAMH